MEKEVTAFLKRRGCKVLAVDDEFLVFFLEGFYGAVFFDRKHMLDLKWFQNNSYGVIINRRNWEEVKKELKEILQ